MPIPQQDSEWQPPIQELRVHCALLPVHIVGSVLSRALPMLWKFVQITTIEGLGKVRESLRAMPHLAAHVQHFSLHWWQSFDTDVADQYGPEYGTSLDMAFSDRGAMWNRERRQLEGAVTVEDNGVSVYFANEYGNLEGPGRFLRQRSREDDGDSDVEFLEVSGPDGHGPDARIESPQDFKDCITEVLRQIGSSLRSFAWVSDITPMPMSAFAALTNAKLRRLHFSVRYQRDIDCFCEFHATMLLRFTV